MPQKNDVIDAQEIHDESQSYTEVKRAGTYLVVANDEDEFNVALRYAARRAKANKGHVGILQVIDIEEFQHWGNVEKMMKDELREAAENHVWSIAKKVNDLNGLVPAIYIAEGSTQDVIVELIKNSPEIRCLILSGSTQNSSSNALISYFSSKGLGRLRVPLAIIPGNMDLQHIDDIAI